MANTRWCLFHMLRYVGEATLERRKLWTMLSEVKNAVTRCPMEPTSEQRGRSVKVFIAFCLSNTTHTHTHTHTHQHLPWVGRVCDTYLKGPTPSLRTRCRLFPLRTLALVRTQQPGYIPWAIKTRQFISQYNSVVFLGEYLASRPLRH